MNLFTERRNDTVILRHISIIMPLISLMSTHFLLNSFTLISDMETTTATKYAKIASKYYLKINCENPVKLNGPVIGLNQGFIVLAKPDFDISKLIKTNPKIIVVVSTMGNEDPPIFKLQHQSPIPPSTSFFVVILRDRTKKGFPPEITAKFIQLYKPISNMPLKVFPTMLYGGPYGSKWTWENQKMNWNSIEKETRDMSGVTITIALISSTLEKKKAVKNFWEGRNSYFWRTMQEHLHFRAVVHFRFVAPQAARSVSKIYLTLLMTVADGLGVLPVISSERNHHLEFILTGLDSKYHLMVRSPQYVYSWQSIFKPFALDSWMCLVIGILLISIILRIATAHHRSRPTDFSSCCLTVFGFVCFQGCPVVPRNPSARVVCYTALLFSILIYQFYTSNFYSLLSTKEVSLPFTSLEQFIAKRTHTLYVHPDTAIYAHIVKAQKGTFKNLWDKFLKKDPFHQLKPDTRLKSFEKVCKGKGAILGLPFQTLHLNELPCTLVPVNSGYFPTNIVTITRKKFPFKSQFQFVHMRLFEAGITHRFRDKFLNQLQHKGKANVVNEPVSLEHVAFLFAFLATSTLLSWLILSFEVLASTALKTKRHQESN